jgi:SAM-dependent methyltransferase
MDQSARMLAAARAKFPDVPSEKRGLQDVRAEAAFDGICCVDAMENICPEDWPGVLRNFARALKPGAPLYLTVELADANEIEAAYATGLRLGLPLVRGEWAHEGGNHYYPELGRVRAWLVDAEFTVRAEETGDGYFHILAARAG